MSISDKYYFLVIISKEKVDFFNEKRPEIPRILMRGWIGPS